MFCGCREIYLQIVNFKFFILFIGFAAKNSLCEILTNVLEIEILMKQSVICFLRFCFSVVSYMS